jgi:alkanesulfonate monooxygenase SsuD/methylene tetrahydromethanopterin reductase-like flavin-dependent oxidoreductase (luciferase family)
VREVCARTNLVHDRVELGLVTRGEDNVETRFGELNHKFASNPVRRTGDD